jgi:phasin
LPAGGQFTLELSAAYEELTMAKEPFDQFAMPNEVRAFVEQSVTQARTAFNSIAEAANQAVSQWQGRTQSARSGAAEIAHKSMAYAEKNMAATFDFAQKLMRAKDPTEVMRLQSEFLTSQMQTLSAQAQELGQSAAKIVMDLAKPKDVGKSKP